MLGFLVSFTHRKVVQFWGNVKLNSRKPFLWSKGAAPTSGPCQVQSHPGQRRGLSRFSPGGEDVSRLGWDHPPDPDQLGGVDLPIEEDMAGAVHIASRGTFCC